MMNRTRATRPRREPGLPIAMAAIVLPLLMEVAPVEANAGLLPDLSSCHRLRVEAGNKLVSHVFAEGVQIYRRAGHLRGGDLHPASEYGGRPCADHSR